MGWQTTTVEGDSMPMNEPFAYVGGRRYCSNSFAASMIGGEYRSVSAEEYDELVTQIASGITEVRFGSIRNGVVYVDCTVCGTAIETDPRGDVLDSSGRCDECRP